jgi:uncharacterized protein YndB with AHSA1/START domain
VTDTSAGTITVEQTIRIAASPETVWTFWTDPQRLAEWWGVAAEVEAEPGGMFRVVMESGPVMRGTFTELDPPHRLVFTFGWEHNAPGEPLAPGSTRVEVTMQPEESGTVLVLRHFDLPAVHAPDHEKGWSYFVGERLVAAAASPPRTSPSSTRFPTAS